MIFYKGMIFTGCHGAFTGRVEVLGYNVDNNELNVRCTVKNPETGRFSSWEETWNLQHTEWGFGEGTYYMPNSKHFEDWPE